MIKTTTLFCFLILTFSATPILAQAYTFEDFHGTWNGFISSETFQPYNDPITMTIEADGYYTETSGHLMPTIYPNTQECEFDAETNRMHWWYLQTVYAGQYFYQHFFFEVVYFSNDTLEMHYNFWDDPEPHPQVGTIFLTRQTTVGVDDNTIAETERKVVAVFDVMGNKVASDTRGQILIFQFSDGSTEKRFIL